jgi:hypothetical protein
MRHAPRILASGLLTLVALAVATPAQAQASAAKGSRPAAFLDKESAFTAGRTVYLRSTKTLIGTIEKTDESHAFPPTFPKSPAKAVLIRRKDRSKSWVPVEGITKIYVVGK